MAADPARTSVSGLSSGGSMAVQYDVAFSSSTVGVGVVAGAPYNCVYTNVGGIDTCLNGSPSGAASFAGAKGFAEVGAIDPVANLANGKVYLFSGTQDPIVKQTVMNAVRDFYVAARVPAANLVFVDTVPAGHALISPISGAACSTTGLPFVDQCAVGGAPYEQPAAILTQIYGPLQPKASTLSSKPAAFDHAQFGLLQTGMASRGYIYIPSSCRASKGKGCAVHVVFHGCEQGSGVVGDAVYAKVGYNAWADTNGIIVLYPQINPTMPANMAGCWDWWGYTGLNYQTRGGAQLSAIRQMVARLTGL